MGGEPHPQPLSPEREGEPDAARNRPYLPIAIIRALFFQDGQVWVSWASMALLAVAPSTLVWWQAPYGLATKVISVRDEF